MGQGFQRILKIYGEMKVTDSNGNSVTHVWDYANDKPQIKGEMTKEEIAERKVDQVEESSDYEF